MAIDHAAEVKRYEPQADDKVIKGIVKHLGIALSRPDSSFVSCSSKDELARVRESWLRKKLALNDDDAVLDAAIAEVCTAMKADHSKNRVVFYYLLAKRFGKLGALA
jgi:hypothetical protein